MKKNVYGSFSYWVIWRFCMKTKVAVVGLGKMGLLHASILSTMPEVEILALCDKSSMLLRIAKSLFKGAKLVNDVSKLGDFDINSAYVTTPIPSHFGVISDLVSGGIVENVFVEKTLGSSWDTARALCDLARDSKGVNMVGYMKRFSVTFGKAKSLLAEEVLGKLVSFDAYALSSDFSNVKKGSRKSAVRGGVLRDLGSHVIDLAGWFFGDFEVGSASLESIVDEGSEDAANFEVVNSVLNGRFRVSWCADKYRMPSFGLAIAGDKGTMKVDDYSLELNLSGGKATRWFRQDLGDSVAFLLGDPEYYREDDAFVKSVLSGGKAEPSFETASRTDRIIDQVKKEADSNGC
jgi:predicted dehydrogenase